MTVAPQRIQKRLVNNITKEDGISDNPFRDLRRKWSIISSQMQLVETWEQLLKNTTKIVREILDCDRVLIYKFITEETGEILAESRTTGWTPANGETLPATTFGYDSTEDYLREEVVIVNTTDEGLTPYQLQLLANFQIQTSLSIPIINHGEVWGLLVLQECRESREWDELDLTLLYQVRSELLLGIERTEFKNQMRQLSEGKETATAIVERIRESVDLDKILKLTTKEIRSLLKTDRVGIFRFNPDFSGEFIVESVGTNWTPLVMSDQPGEGIIDAIGNCEAMTRLASGTNASTSNQVKVNDTYLQDTKGGRFRTRQAFAIDDIYEEGYPPCYLEVLEKFETRAYVHAPIFHNNKLWGLLACYNNTGPRKWKDYEVKWVIQIAGQLGLALQQAETLKQLKGQTEKLTLLAEQEQAVNRVSNRLFAAKNVADLYHTTAKEIRAMLKSDRVCIFKYLDNYHDGCLVGEDQNPVYPSPMTDKVHDPCYGPFVEKYKQGHFRAITDINKSDLINCVVNLLSKYEVKGSLNVPLILNDELWGLICIHQCDGPREWLDSEISFVQQIANQFNLVYQLKEQSDKTTKLATQEQTLNRITNRLYSADTLPHLFQIATREIRSLLKCDRVCIYQYLDNYHDGMLVGEDYNSRYRSAMKDQVHDPCYGPFVEKYKQGHARPITDIRDSDLFDCVVELLSPYEVKGSLNVPLMINDELWGLFCIHQCDGPREWSTNEVELIKKIALQFSLAYQLTSQTQRATQLAKQEQTITKISTRIFESLDLDTIFTTTARETRLLLNCDRVAVFRFKPETAYLEGEFVSEDVQGGYSAAKGRIYYDERFPEHVDKYRSGVIQSVPNIHTSTLTQCHIDQLASFEVIANLITPLLVEGTLWGFLCIHQCSGPRNWTDEEILFAKQIASQFNLALQQEAYVTKLKEQSERLADLANRERNAKESLQMGAINLLRSVRPALDGDLTVRAPITEDELGTVADSYNNTLQALRKIIIQVQEAAQKVAATSRSSESSMTTLTKLAQDQFEEISKSLEKIEQMGRSTQAVAENAQLVESAVQKANNTVKLGDDAMNRTVEGIQVIRDTVSQTSKKIKRLSESANKISKAVSLISNLATQTNVLAFNAAIEATRAGEYGKGFAVVADEVRSLSKQSAAATTEIEKLVQETQAETMEVANAMEQGIQQVVDGTNLVNETRQSLNEIVAATAEISKLVVGITKATQRQKEQSESVTEVMQGVAEISNQSSENSLEMSASFKRVLDTAQELLVTAGQFKVN
jgi:methyl-accepting chemotaxis protein PixJ